MATLSTGFAPDHGSEERTPASAPKPAPTWGTYLRFARRHMRLIVCGMVLGLFAGMGWVLLQPPTYSATASVVLSPVPSYVSVVASERLPRRVTIDTDAQLLRDPYVLAAVAEAVDVDRSVVLDHLSVTAVPLTRVLRVTFKSRSRHEAALAATTAAEAFITVRQRSLGALQDDQILGLGYRIEELQNRLGAQTRGNPVLAPDDPLVLQIAELRDRYVDLERTRTSPAEVTRTAIPPVSADPSNSEVPLTSGLMTGLLLGCAVGATRDFVSARRGRQRLSERSPTISAIAV